MRASSSALSSKEIKENSPRRAPIYYLHRSSPRFRLIRSRVHRHAYSARVDNLVIASLSLVFLFCGLVVVAGRPFFGDELFTLQIFRLGSVSRIWSALVDGGDGQPLPYYILLRGISYVVGSENLALRLPSLFGLMVCSYTCYLIVRKYLGAGYGILAFLLPMLTVAWIYGFEARPYGLVLGAAGCAFYSWTCITERASGWKAYLLFLLSLLCLTCSHYYAPLALIPLMLAELFRSQREKKLYLPFWFAVAASLFPYLFFAPHLSVLRDMSKTFWSKPSLASFSDAYLFLFSPLLFPLCAAFAAGALILAVNRAPSPESETEPCLPPHVVFCAALFFAFPFIVVLAAMLAQGGFLARYTLPTVIGAAILLPMLLARAKLHTLVVPCTILLFMTWFAKEEVKLALSTSDASRKQFIQSVNEILAEPSLPLVIDDFESYFAFITDNESKSPDKMYFINDKLHSLQYRGTDTNVRIVAALAADQPEHTPDFKNFIARYKRFRLLGNRLWMLEHLAASAASIRFLGFRPGMYAESLPLYEVKLADDASD